MSERLRDKLDTITNPDTISGARSVLEDTGKTAKDHAIENAKAGQPVKAADFVLLALENGEIDSNQATGIMVNGLENRAELFRGMRRSDIAEESDQEASEWRELISE